MGTIKKKTTMATPEQHSTKLGDLAEIYMTDPAFSQCRADEKLWENTIDSLIEQITPENLPDKADIDWGKPRGSEIW